MARKPSTVTPQPEEATLVALPAMAEAANRLAVMGAEQDTMVRAVAVQLGYQLPADCTDPDLIQRDIAANMRRSVEACLEVGKGLRVLKEACQHGNFVARLDVLGIDRHVAARFIQAAVKFSNVPTSAHLTQAIGTQSKLLEMLVLDDEQIEELALTGQTGELALDDIATMSVKELRHALREARDNAETQGRLIASKDAKLNELDAKLTKHKKLKVAVTDWPERFKGLMDQADLARRTIENQIGALDAIRAAAMEDEAADEAEEASLQRARETLAANIASSMARLTAALDGFGSVFEKTLGAFVPEEA